MRKSITKIICSAVAVISASVLAFAPACSVNWKGVSKDTSKVVDGTNGGFVTETEDYIYFINGVTKNTAVNKFGSVLKGSIQRISRKDFDSADYAKTETVVPSVIYSGIYDAGLYIYGEYIYYTSPATEKNTDGEILNSYLDFKRTKLDGTGTETLWQSTDNGVNYRYVQVGDTVYILYGLNETLYTSSTTNVHSINCDTKVNTLLAYNVSKYVFDTVDAENVSVYYTMNVPQFLGDSTNYNYNQLYKVRADATTPKTIDFSSVENYDADKNPIYVNCGQMVFDGIGKLNYRGRLNQLNYTTDAEKYKDTLLHDDYSYEIQSYEEGKLTYTRKSYGSDLTNMYILYDDEVGNDGKVADTWDAILKNNEQTAFILGKDTDTYYYYKENNVTYAVNASSSGIFRYEVKGQKFDNKVMVSSDSVNSVFMLKKENEHYNLYYSMTGGNGNTFYRIAVDGEDSDYRRLPESIEPDVTYSSVKILDLDAYSSWYKPEFVGDKLLYASVGEGQTNYNYITVCDLSGKNGIMTNNELKALNEKFEGVSKKYLKYKEDDNEKLTNALIYYFYTGDKAYAAELAKAYVDVLGEDEEYAYTKDDLDIIKDFADATGDYAEYAEEGATKTVNGRTVYATEQTYFYTVLGRMTEEDQEAIAEHFKDTYMKEYPVDGRTWWEKLSTGAKAGFIIGMVACGLAVIGGCTVLTIFLIKKLRKTPEEVEVRTSKVDITDDKSVNVYGGDENKQE